MVMQSVLEHLRGTEALAVAFSTRFHGEADASVAALAHDIGKASAEFREHILHPDRPMRVDHSTAGAQAVRNNPRKFRDGYMFELSVEESSDLRSKLLTLEGGKGRHSKYNFKAFTERGLYMLATILKSKRAEDATIAIIETFFKVRSLKRELLELHKETDKEKQTEKMRHFGNVLTDIVMPDLQTQETESSLEINFFIGKIKHTVKRVRKEEK